MKKENGIPAQDLKDINDSFKSGKSVEALNKDASGSTVSASKEVTKESKSYALRDYRGRALRHGKSLIPKGKPQMMIGKKGQKFEDIPEELRDRIMWTDSDFE